MMNLSSYDLTSLVIIVVSIYHLSIGARFTENYAIIKCATVGLCYAFHRTSREIEQDSAYTINHIVIDVSTTLYILTGVCIGIADIELEAVFDALGILLGVVWATIPRIYPKRVKSAMLHCVACTLHIVSAVLIYLLTPRWPEYATRFPLTYESWTAQGPGLNITYTTYTAVSSTNPMIWVTYNEALTAFSHLVALVILTINDDKWIYIRRWFEYAVTAGLLEIAILLNVGIKSIYIVILVLWANVTLQLFGLVLENQKLFLDVKLNKKGKTCFLVIGFMVLAPILVVVAWSSQNWTLLGLDNTVYIEQKELAVFYLIFYSSFGIVQIFQVERKFFERDTEYLYTLLSITSKIFLSWTVISMNYDGFQGLGIEENTLDHRWTVNVYDNVNWNGVQIGIGVGCIAILGGGMWISKSDKNIPVKCEKMQFICTTVAENKLRF
mgnify:FL=1